MESLALMVAIIFLVTILSGPISLLLMYFNMNILSIIFAIIAILFGINWILVTPFPVSLFGIISIFCSIISIKKLFI
jgi:hypothetical protein